MRRSVRISVGIIAVLAICIAGSTVPAGAAGSPIPRAATTRALSAPPQPVLVSAVPEGLGAIVTWDPEPSLFSVSSFTVSASFASGFAGTIAPNCTSPVTRKTGAANTATLVASLCVGVPYVFTVEATNGAGTSVASNSSDPVVPLPAQPPSVPLITSVLRRSQALVVDWAPPSLNGGDSLSGFALTVSSPKLSKTYTTSPTTDSLTLKGLTNGSTYSLSLVAKSKAGLSVSATAEGTPSATVAPGVPQSFQALPTGSGDLDVSWSPPADTGTSPLRGYKLTLQGEAGGASGWIPSGPPHTLYLSASTTEKVFAALQGYYEISLTAFSKAGSGPVVSTKDPVTPAVVLSPNAVVLTQTTLDSAASFLGGVLTWNNPAPAQVKRLKAGDIVIGAASPAAPDGLLLSVRSVSTGTDGVTVSTGPASLSEAFHDLSFSTSSSPFAQSSATFEPAVAGIRSLAARPNVSVTLSRTFGFNLGRGPINVSGSTSLTGNLSLSASIIKNVVRVPDGVSMTASAKVTASASVEASIGGSDSWKLGQISGSPIPFDIAGVPFTLVPTIPVFLSVSGSISVGASASLTVGASLSWSSKAPGSISVQNLTGTPGISGKPLVGVSAKASGSVSLAVQPQLEVDGIGGPNVQVTASLSANVDFLTRPYFTLKPSVAVAVGVDINFLYIHDSLEYTLKTESWSPFIITSSPTATLTLNPRNASVSPGGQLQMSATRSDGRSFPITWRLVGSTSSDSISSSGLINVGFPADRTFTVVATDSTGAEGKTSVTVTTPGTPSAPLNVQAVNIGQTSATIVWSAPSSDGGSDINSYQVTGAGSGCSTGGGGTSCGISGLAPGTGYEACVQPINIAGGGAEACTDFETTQNSPPPRSISVSWGGNSAPAGKWMDITFNGFPTGSVTWYCVEEGTAYGPYSTTLTSSPETLTTNTCYDTERGGSDYVTAGGVNSNTIGTD